MGFRSDRRDEDDSDGRDDFKSNKPKGASSQEALLTLTNQVAGDIAKLNTEYTKFFTGAEKKPPRDLRIQLDRLIEKIDSIRKTSNLSPSLGMKVQSALASYQSYKNLWDKQMLERERGTRSK